MTHRLSPLHLGTTSILTRESLFRRLQEGTIHAEPDISDMAQYDMAPDDLRQQGIDVPVDEDEALEFAIERFKESDSFYEWQDQNIPMMMYLWPCDPLIDVDTYVALLAGEGLACCFTEAKSGTDDDEDDEDQEYKGIMMTGGGMDLSDQVGLAYILAGYIPPEEILFRGISNTRSDEIRERLLDAAEQASAHYTRIAERFTEQVERYRGDGLKP